MIYITGDTHHDVDSQKIFDKAVSLSKNDYVIIAGDFGGVWYYQSSDKYKEQEQLLDKYASLDCNVLFIDGNHENFVELQSYPTIKKFDGIVGQIRENLFHLKRGEIYTIQKKKIFTFGGALSVDKHLRMPYVSWWEEEIPTVEEMNYGLDNLQKHDNKVDYIITHTAPKEIVIKLLENNKWDLWGNKKNDPTTDYLQKVKERVKFERWFFGHFHTDCSLNNKFIALYNNFVELF